MSPFFFSLILYKFQTISHRCMTSLGWLGCSIQYHKTKLNRIIFCKILLVCVRSYFVVGKWAREHILDFTKPESNQCCKTDHKKKSMSHCQLKHSICLSWVRPTLVH
ncbi:hypothetical protein O6H91_05G032500 [Diphasiastrum complanatum]|uniref:Uncharacterized protein n=1 Tax=Diphasiastrum complanatum TaxID=34168 RepID=A0ACC2DLZ1_DIPCM|nr:hypothetical protein O6H91_05G032500 [Diphasiastrum complanatum]